MENKEKEGEENRIDQLPARKPDKQMSTKRMISIALIPIVVISWHDCISCWSWSIIPDEV